MIRTPSALRALLLPLFSALALHAPAALASADSFPNKPVRIIVPVAPGGSADKLTRLLAERLATQTALHVREGKDGAPVRPAEAWLAPGNHHMEMVREAEAVLKELGKLP